MIPTDGDDRGYLARAIAVAADAEGRTSPNPGVGCVVVRGGRIVGEGATAPVGGPHAEAVALASAGDAAQGSTAYVTLEPCAHQGRTAACTDALLAAGVQRVVVGRQDPNPAAGGGAERLMTAGLEVRGPLSGDDPLGVAIDRQLEGFSSVIARGRPHLTLKLAQTVDGQLVAPPPSRWITSLPARRAVHRWRATRDAVLVGSGTVLADDPRLDVRHVASTRAPRPIVFDGRLRTPPHAQVVRRGALIVTCPAAPLERRKRLLDAGAEVVEVPAAPAMGVELVAALELLARHGINSVFAEPGATLAGALLEAGLVDRLVLHVAVDGPVERRTERIRWALPVPGPAQGWELERLGGAGPDLVIHLRAPATASSNDTAMEDR